MFCTKCGQKLEDCQTHCLRCGTPRYIPSIPYNPPVQCFKPPHIEVSFNIKRTTALVLSFLGILGVIVLSLIVFGGTV